MTSDAPMALFADEELLPPAGHPERFGTRWRLVGAGLSNVWRYGDLVLDAASGRLLLRGPNGTGKTTALEALWPYLLDLNAQRLVAGKARTTSLSSLMREGAAGKRRYGYVWLTLVGPGSEGTHTFGVRLQYSEGASPQVKVIPFTIPSEPFTDVQLHGDDRAPLMLEQFTETVKDSGGEIFDDDESYVAHLAARVWGTSPAQLRDLAQRIRAVRNPSLLGDVSPRAASEALREALPGVADDIITATSEALAESESTRDAFARDNEAAEVLHEFAATWAGHVTAVAIDVHTAAADAATQVSRAAAETRRLSRALEEATSAHEEARTGEEALHGRLRDLGAQLNALEQTDAYKAAGALSALDEQLAAEQKNASAIFGQLTAAAKTVRDQTASLTHQVNALADDLNDQVTAASEADIAATLDGPLLAWTSRPRAVVTVGGETADPGPSLTLDTDPERVDSSAQHWSGLAHRHNVRAGDAQLAISDFKKTVQPAAEAAQNTKIAAERAASEADAAKQREDRATNAARGTATELLNQIVAWPVTPDDLYADTSDEGDTDDPTLWTTANIDELRLAEPGQILDEVDSWESRITTRSSDARAYLRQQWQALLTHATTLATNAKALRSQAAALRSGQLLPLPRPAWLDSTDDTTALGAALEWSPQFSDPTERALVENALAASGLLSAALTTDGATTSAWQVRPTGPVTPYNLTAVISVDAEHPLADAATDVLTRITLNSTAARGDDGQDETTLVIGRDGTFRAGPLVGRPPGVDGPELLAAAQHVGAAQRRAAAIARADDLDREATELDGEAAAARAAAGSLQEQAAAIERHARSFPPIRALEQAEAARVAAAKEAARLNGEATSAQAAALSAAEHAAAQRAEWSERTRARSLPADQDALSTIQTESTAAASALTAAVTALSGRLRGRLQRLVADVRQLDETVGTLPTLRAEAKDAHDEAGTTAEKLRVLRANSGQAAQKAVNDHATASRERAALRKQTEPARTQTEKAAAEMTRLDEQLAAAERAEQEAKPTADRRRNELSALLAVPGVTEVLFSHADGEHLSEDNLLDGVKIALEGRRTYGRKTLRERYDAARAALAGTWTLDPSDTYGDLDTFVLTHDDMPYTPVAADRRAAELKEKAQAALDAAEEAALRDFIVGRLPSAIGTAWTRLHDWVNDVNRKMRSAAASSGVGVRVRARLADDLSPAARTVYELACKVADADRTREQKAAVGQALQQLIAAADGPTMAEQLAAAVDVREWVDVHYEVTRPGETAQRWSSKTGLSGGERRLVVLAPMIAAVAAAYDGLTPSGLRLAALDEVPAEVDERGREGLARYMAELDLDLVCTSYLWDGAPGAWDGVDAHDLEAAEDGTVVAFPMLIRGLVDLPGDPTFEPHS